MPKKGLGVCQIGLNIILCGDICQRRWVKLLLCKSVYINIVITVALFNSICICATFIGFGARQVYFKLQSLSAAGVVGLKLIKINYFATKAFFNSYHGVSTTLEININISKLIKLKTGIFHALHIIRSF